MLLVLQLATLVGCSMGAAVIWAHLELFGDARIGKCVFVDQAPLQVRKFAALHSESLPLQ